MKIALGEDFVKVLLGAKNPADDNRFGTSEVDSRVRLSGVGEKSAVAQIAQLVQEAQFFFLKAPARISPTA